MIIQKDLLDCEEARASDLWGAAYEDAMNRANEEYPQYYNARYCSLLYSMEKFEEQEKSYRQKHKLNDFLNMLESLLNLESITDEDIEKAKMLKPKTVTTTSERIGMNEIVESVKTNIDGRDNSLILLLLAIVALVLWSILLYKCIVGE